MNANGISEFKLFSDHCLTYDWSQFKPRGHYVSPLFPELAKYFRCMMWLGRMEIYLIKPNENSGNCGQQTFEDVQRQIIDAYLIDELFNMAYVYDQYHEVENILEYFVGKQDNVTLDNLDYLKNAVQIDSASQFLDSSKVVLFQDSLRNQSFAHQLILSQLLNGNPMTPDSIIPASAFMLFGQRFVIDSYVTGSVVYDRIKYLGQDVCRLFPSTLDPNFALGNNSAAQLLQDELNQYHYSTNLAALRYLIDSYSSDYWESSLYKFWLNGIRKLNAPEDRSNLPEFMRTAAFWQEKINTQLSSWIELRHDNLLYAKQSYTGIPICSFPYSYVEPFPELYNDLKNTGNSALNYFQSLNFTDYNIKQNIVDYFSRLADITDTLSIISQKELDNTSLNSDETTFLQNMLYYMPYYTGDTVYTGWYPELFYQDFAFENDGFMGKNYLVADYHTTPADCGGSMIGWVLHAGTGPFDVGVFNAEIPGSGEECSFIGPVLSYREYTTTNFLRLTDDEWKDSYMYLSNRPDFVNLYLADSSGNSRGSGRELITDVKTIQNRNIPLTHLVVKNYPNPFNPSTIISFTIPVDLSNKNAELIVYDIQGRVVKHLINRELPTGTYLAKWNSKNDSGTPVASGIYIYRLKIADRQAVGKMNLIK